MTIVSRRKLIYHTLRNDCHFTHEQTKWLIRIYLTHLGDFDRILSDGASLERKKWEDEASVIASICTESNPTQAGKQVMEYAWPEKEDGGSPRFPHICVAMACRKIVKEKQYNNKDATLFRYHAADKIRNYERKTAEIDWDSRMILTYLKIKKLI
jgi:hypothetical protein